LNKSRSVETKVEGQFEYHYNREERLSSLSPKARAQLEKVKGPWWKKNPGQAMTLLDIVLIALVIGVLFPIIQNFVGNPSLGGYQWQGNFYLIQEQGVLVLEGKGDGNLGEAFQIKVEDSLGTILFQGEQTVLQSGDIQFILTFDPQEQRSIEVLLTYKEEEKQLFFQGKSQNPVQGMELP